MDELTTERLTLEPLREEHAAGMVAVLDDPGLYVHIGGEPPSLDALESRYRHQIQGPGRTDESWCNWIVRRADSGAMVGFVQATVVADRADVAWLIGTEHQHQGFAAEAAAAMLAWLEGRGVRHISAHVGDANVASARVAERIGLVRTGAVDDDGEEIWSRSNTDAVSGSGEVAPADPIVIVDYDETWPAAFDLAASELRAALAPWIVEIEHIGSTAVPGLAAKPVIDVQVGVRSLRPTPEIVASIEALGYDYVPEFERELPNRRYFRRSSASGVRTHQIHLVERSDVGWWDRHILFRDWLRDHAADRERYAALKRVLAVDYRNDRSGYTEAKSAFIAGIVERASGATGPATA